MKKLLACKTIFFLALTLCISISFLSCSNQRKLSAEEKVLETWNAFFRNVIQNENPIEENLSVATVHSVDGKDFCKDKALVESEELILKIKTLETQNLLNIRNIIRNMTPPEIENADFVNLLNEFAVNSAKFSDIPCKFYAEKSELFKKISGTQKLHIFRIIQEAVTNAEKHSGAEEISIFARTETFPSDDEKSRKQILVFIVSDDGKGMDKNFFLQNTFNKFESHTANSKISITDQSTHLGLKGILSRAEIIGGTVEIKSSAEIGTTIILKVEC